MKSERHPILYLSKGFDEKMARYFASGRKKIMAVSPSDNFTLLLRFDNGVSRRFDMKPIIKPETVFAFLGEDANFQRVYLDECNCVAWDIDPTVDSQVVYNNKVELSPDTCYVDSVPI